MNSLDREIEDLQTEARLIRQATFHLRRQLAEWDSMLMTAQNKLFDLYKLRRPSLEKEYRTLTGEKK